VAADDAEKTEEPTAHKLESAREKGDVAQSRDFANFFVFLGVALALYFSGQSMVKMMLELFPLFIESNRFSLNNVGDVQNIFGFVIKHVLWILAPLFGALFIFGIAAYISQFGLLFTTEKLTPQIEKLNPISGFSRIFSKETAMEFVKSSIKVVVMSAVLYLLFVGEMERINQIGAQPIAMSFQYLIEIIGKVILAVVIFLAVLGVLDLGFQKWAYVQRMKMSLQEVKDEMKQREGDPHIRARIRQIQRDRARARMMDDVPKADVVVTNPTHVAVALRYKRGETKAPIVLAKGAGFIALKIKEKAALAGIPIVEKKQLARYIYKHIEVGDFIPESLYTAVAEVLAYVYRLKKKFHGMMNKGVA
jgi:flagellar biosynthetic protein FlhB